VTTRREDNLQPLSLPVKSLLKRASLQVAAVGFSSPIIGRKDLADHSRGGKGQRSTARHGEAHATVVRKTPECQEKYLIRRIHEKPHQ
jgi:hypothetical protein